MGRTFAVSSRRSWYLGLAVCVTLVGLTAFGRAGGLPGTAPYASTIHAAVPGSIAFGHLGDVWVAEGGHLRQITQGGRYWGQPEFSPDGSKLALVGWGPSVTDLFVMNADGSDLRQITQSRKRRLQDSDWTFFPQWSRDGEQLAFTVDRGTDYPMLWVARADGSNSRQVTRSSSTFDGVESFSWAPDGVNVALTRFNQQASQIHLVNIASPGRTQPITNEPEGAYDPAWSPDGRFIAYAARMGRRTALKVHDTAGLNQPQTLIEGDLARSPTWSPNSSALAYIALVGREFELHVIDVSVTGDGELTAGHPVQLTARFGVDATSGLSWAP